MHEAVPGAVKSARYLALLGKSRTFDKIVQNLTSLKVWDIPHFFRPKVRDISRFLVKIWPKLWALHTQMVAQPLCKLTCLLVFLRELPKVCGPFSAALVVRVMVVQPLAYCSCHSAMSQWNRSRVVANSAGSGELVFTSMDALLVRTVALRQAIFKRIKGFTTWSYSISSQEIDFFRDWERVS
jgi:hypothetical protein